MATAEIALDQAGEGTFTKAFTKADTHTHTPPKAASTDAGVKQRKVSGAVTNEEHETMAALIRTCGYSDAETFVSEAVSEKIRSLHGRVQAQFGPKKKR